MWKADSKGPAEILTIYAPTEPGDCEDLWDVHQYLDRIVTIRQQLIDGDLRLLYVAWMCGCQSDEIDPDSANEPPVPAGLAESSDAIAAMLNSQEQARQKRLADMPRSPRKYLDDVDKHVAMRKTAQYEEAAQILSDIREAVGGQEGDQISRNYVAHLKKKHPTLKMLVGLCAAKGCFSEDHRVSCA